MKIRSAFLPSMILALVSMSHAAAPDIDMFRGVIVPMVTPYSGAQAEAVDLKALRALTRRLCRTRATTLFPVSGTGQWKKLTMDEKRAIIDACVKAARRKKPVLAGVGSPNNVEEVVELARFAEKAGASGVAVVTPSFIRDVQPEIGGRRRIIDQQILVDYYTRVAGAVACPIMIYDAEGEVEPGTFARLVETCPNIRAIKVRPRPDPIQFPAMVDAARGRAAVITGAETAILHPVQQGAVGVIGGGLNVYPDLAADLFDAIRGNRWARAEELQRMIVEANARLERLGGGAQGVKKILNDVIGVKMSTANRGDEFAPESRPGEHAEIVSYFRALESRGR